MARTLQRHAAGTLGLLLVPVLLGGAGEPAGETPLRVPTVTLMPNAVATTDQTITATVCGDAGQTVYLHLLRDCDGDWREPELPRPGCTALRPPQVLTLKENETRTVFTLPFSGLAPGQPYWLRVSAVSDGTRAYTQALFGLLAPAERCTLWKTLLGTLGVGRHSPCEAGVGKALSVTLGSLGPSDNRPRGPLEVQRWRLVNGKSAREAVPGTRGATGVAWADENTLLVTLRALTAREREGQANEEQPGLWRIDVMRGTRTLLMAAPFGITLAAPRALGAGRVAYVREVEDNNAPDMVGYVEVWAPDAGHGPGTPRTPRPRPVPLPLPLPLTEQLHQLVAVRAGDPPEAEAVLGYGRSLGVPTLVWLELQRGTQTALGFDATLLQAALHAPTLPRTAVAFEDPRDKAGWDLVLVDDAGALAEEVAVGPGDALLPAWRPGAAELAFLATAGKPAGGGR